MTLLHWFHTLLDSSDLFTASEEVLIVVAIIGTYIWRVRQ